MFHANFCLHIWKEEVLRKFSARSDFEEKFLEQRCGFIRKILVDFSTFYFSKILNIFRIFRYFSTIFILRTYKSKLKTNSWKFSGKWKIVWKSRQVSFDRAENFMELVPGDRKNYALSVSFSRYCIKIGFILIKSVHL